MYRIVYLTEENELSDEDRRVILEALIAKCRTRAIEASADSINNPEVRQ